MSRTPLNKEILTKLTERKLFSKLLFQTKKNHDFSYISSHKTFDYNLITNKLWG